jgi:hypothetical protein
MMTGIVSAMIVPAVARAIYGDNLNVLFTFPVIFAASTAGCIAGTLLTKPEDDAILIRFYKQVNPWGAWGPVREKVLLEDPSFEPNPNCSRDWVNVAVGIVWQLCLVTVPTYLVFRNWPWFWCSVAVLAVASVFLKFNWYDRLEKAPAAQ